MPNPIATTYLQNRVHFILGSDYFLRMQVGLIETPATYARMKDITFGPVQTLNQELPAICKEQVRSNISLMMITGPLTCSCTCWWSLRGICFPRILFAEITLNQRHAILWAAQGTIGNAYWSSSSSTTSEIRVASIIKKNGAARVLRSPMGYGRKRVLQTGGFIYPHVRGSSALGRSSIN